MFSPQLRWTDTGRKIRISHSQPFDGFDDENWPAMIEWLCQHFVKLDQAFSEPLASLNRCLRAQGGIPVSDQTDSR